MKKILILALFFFSQTFFYCQTRASELLYQPQNPAFGGNPLNGSYLLGRAQAQNNFKDPKAFSSRDPLENFEDTLTRQVLNQISRRVLDQAFGQGELEAGGLFVYGDFEIEIITTNPDFILLTITDTTTGDVTEIEIPIFADN